MKRTFGFGCALGALFIGAALRPAMANLVKNGSFETVAVDPNSNGDPTPITANQPNTHLLTLAAGNTTSITFWTVTGMTAGATTGPGSIDLIGDKYWQPSDGHNSLDLDGTRIDGATPAVTGGPGGIEQLISGLTIGDQYTVSFDLAGNPDVAPPTPKTLGVEVTIDGVTTESTFTFDSTGKSHTAMGWVSRSVTFTATKTDVLLEFRSLDVDPALGGNWGPALDNVDLEDITPVGAPGAPGTHGVGIPEPLTAGSAILALAASAGAFTRRRR